MDDGPVGEGMTWEELRKAATMLFVSPPSVFCYYDFPNSGNRCFQRERRVWLVKHTQRHTHTTSLSLKWREKESRWHGAKMYPDKRLTSPLRPLVWFNLPSLFFFPLYNYSFLSLSLFDIFTYINTLFNSGNSQESGRKNSLEAASRLVASTKTFLTSVRKSVLLVVCGLQTCRKECANENNGK